MLDYSVFFLIVLILGIFPSIYYIRNYSKIEEKNEENNKKRIHKNIIYLNIFLTIINLIYFIIFKETQDLNTFIFFPLILIIIGGFIERREIFYFFLIYNLFILFTYIRDYL